MKRAKLKHGTRVRAKTQVTLAPNPWDMGADGPANRIGLIEEAATEIDPETGKETPNPNNVRRFRKLSAAEEAQKKGALEQHHVTSAKELLSMSEGRVMGGGDPLAAITVRTPGGGPVDMLASKFDARRAYHAKWGEIPGECRHPIERLVIEDESETQVFGKKLCDIIEGYAKIRVGLQAVFGEHE